jgi:dihydrofolate reductase
LHSIIRFPYNKNIYNENLIVKEGANIMLSIIVAVGKNNVIGKDNKLLWTLPSDLKYFKEITFGKTIIMGRKTFQSLPGVLPGRRHVVLTKDKSFKIEDDRVTIVNSIEDLLSIVNKGDNFVIGGGQIYKALLPYCDNLYLTMVEKEYEGDIFFPEIRHEEWELVNKINGKLDEKNLIPHSFLVFKRIRL